MTRTLAGLVALMLALSALLFVDDARAHDFEPGVLSVREVEPGRYAYAFSEPIAASARTGAEGGVSVRFPGGCTAGAGVVACGPEGLVGEIELVGLSSPEVPVVVSITRLGGAREEHVAFGARPRVRVGSATAAPPPSSLLGWARLGVEHVLGGFDHLAFVALLTFLAATPRRIVATVTGFTLAHSLTLALAVSGALTLPGPPVEATIAASIVLLAREVMTSRDGPETLARRAPWGVAFVFGLIHGLGFAGALRSIGLPGSSWLGPLATFNVGIEAGQLAIVLVVSVVRRGVAWLPRPRVVEGAALALLGGLGTFWFVERVAALLSG